MKPAKPGKPDSPAIAIGPVFMIWVPGPHIGMYGKSEKISAADPARCLVIEWTAQLPTTRRNTSHGDSENATQAPRTRA